MPRRFQFSLGRLMVALSAVCMAAATLAAGIAASGKLAFASVVILDAIIVGAVIGLLVSERPTRGAFRGACWALSLSIAAVPLAAFALAFFFRPHR